MATTFDYSNTSQFQYGDFDQLVSEPCYAGEVPVRESYTYEVFGIVTGYIKIILYLVVISADLFLISVICRFKNLKTRTNMYVLNCSILNILHIASSPILCYLGYRFMYRDDASCFLNMRIMNTFFILYIVFALGLAMDWFLTSYWPNLMQNYNKHYKYTFMGVYVVFFIEATVALFQSYQLERYIIFSILYTTSLVVIGILNILAQKPYLSQDSHITAYSLIVSNIMLFSYLPLLIKNALYKYYLGNNYFLLYTEFIPEFIGIVHPIFVVYMLGKQNKYFKMAYKRSFKRSINSYGDDNLDDGPYDQGDENYIIKVDLTKSKQKSNIVEDV